MSKDNIIQFPTSKIKDDHQKDIDNTSWWLDLDLSNVPSDDAEVIMFMRMLHEFTSITTEQMIDHMDYELFYHAKYGLAKLLKECKDRDFGFDPRDVDNPENDE